MLLSSIFFLLLSNSLSYRRDITIFYSRVGIIILFYCIFLSYNNLFITYLDNGIGLFGGLFYTSSITQTFHILIFNMTGFYPRKLLSNDYMSFNKLVFTKLQFVKNIAVSNIILKKGEQY